jgi:hypothetical protein
MKGEQNRIDLVIIPLKPQFPLLRMNLRYEIGGYEHAHSIVLPNSALKFVHFMEVSKQDFLSQWEQTSTLYRTTEFNLSHNLPPDSLVRWIPSLQDISSYTNFVVPGSKKDYEVCTAIILMQRHEALLRIIIRPNLKVVLQLGTEETN